MPKDDANLQETVKQLAEIFSDIKTEEDLHTTVALIKSHYVKREDIDKMIWARIEQNQKNKSEGKINWTIVLQTVIAAIIVAGIAGVWASKGT